MLTLYIKVLMMFNQLLRSLAGDMSLLCVQGQKTLMGR
jgi:hypothetical protein